MLGFRAYNRAGVGPPNEVVIWTDEGCMYINDNLSRYGRYTVSYSWTTTIITTFNLILWILFLMPVKW